MNEYNIKNGSVLEATEDKPFLGIRLGQRILLYFWNGAVWCVGGLSWSIEQLTKEISEGLWKKIN